MGQYEGESFGKPSNNFSTTNSKFYAIAGKCANCSAAAVATAAAYTSAIASTTTSTTIAKLGADANSAGKTGRISSKNMGHCVIKRGWWSR